ncbi:Fic family protein [Sphingomonas sp. dw_22]|uniref:Fic family protein n=1 Tax=Sphingomonas sp. dw_22 TaxID=2721175 RepID=UPI001BD3A7B6|nr:Fic family protein [Sphingomonas sp. dw_22]
MRWNWQQPDWPNFAYEAKRLRSREDQFLKGAGVLVGVMAHLDADDRQNLSIELMAQDAVDSSAIEGEILDRASVQSSLAKHLGIKADHRRANAAEAGAAELMANLFRSYGEPISDTMLFHWHALLMNGRRDLADIGRYRTHADPMQIVSGALHEPKVHFEAPPSQAVPTEMKAFISWFNDSRPDGPSQVSALARAGIAHLWFESIHPFEDGNGRLGRAIAEKALAQGLDVPAITAFAETVQRHRKDYYSQLQRASLSNDIDEWLGWFSDIVLAAQQRTLDRAHFLLTKTKLLDRLRGQINARQEKALLRMFAEGPDGFKGGLSAANYRTITDAAPATATRDLAELVELGGLRKEGELKHTRYYLNLGE